MPLSQEKLEDEKSISFFKNKRTPFKGIDRGVEDVENLFIFLTIKLQFFSSSLPLVFFLHSRAVHVISQIGQSR